MKVLSIAILNLLILCSCQSAYYKIWETLGKEKRDLLKSELSKAESEQRDMEEEFKDTLSRIRAEYNFDGGDLQKLYDKVDRDYNKVLSKKNVLESRTEKVNRIANDLFDEWREEAKELSNKSYRNDSLRKLAVAKKNFGKMSSSLATTQKKLETVTKKYKDQVIYLKHNLNAKSLSAFRGEFKSIRSEMEILISSISKSIRESDQFQRELP